MPVIIADGEFLPDPGHGPAEQMGAPEAFLELERCIAKIAARLDGFGSLSAAGLTASQFDVLEAVFRSASILQNELREGQRFSKEDMTSILNRLERAGWLIRRRLAEDRRFLEVRLTEAGHALVCGLLPQRAKAAEAVFSALSDAEQQELQYLLQKLDPVAASPCVGRR